MSVAILIANIQMLQPMNIFLACSLALGVAIQNIPESSTISFYYNQKGKNKFVSFLFSAISGIVEPIFGLVAILLFSIFSNILPILLSLSAGTMLYVTLKELLPECYENYGKSKTAFQRRIKFRKSGYFQTSMGHFKGRSRPAYKRFDF